MKTLFLIQGWNVAASRYRVLQYVPYLESQGVETKVALYPETFRELYAFFRGLPNYDCVFLQRKRFHEPLLTLLRKRANKIVYDFDDSVMYRNSKAASPYSATRQRRFAAMVRASDSVIAGNNFLRDEAAKFTGQVTTIPTAIDQSRYPAKEYDLTKERVTIGWIGDHGSIHYLEKMRPVFEELGRKYPHVELEIICDIFFDCDNMPVVKRMWSTEREIEYLHELDIGVMPLVQDPWSEGKCGLKILQYFGVGVPVICTPVGVNKDVVREGFNGYFAGSQGEWIEKLSLLIEDREKRNIMGMRGREIVFTSFSLQACAPKFYNVLLEGGSKKDAKAITPAVKKYSIDKIDWFLAEEGLRGVVEQFSHPEGKRRHYGIYDYQGEKVFIKSFLEKGLTGRIRHLFSPRGKTEFLIGAHLDSLTIPTPKVLGYGIGKYTSAIVEEYIDGQSLLYAIQKTAYRNNLLTLLAGLLKQLRLKCIRHNDLHLDNILMQNNRLYLIDLHKTRIKNAFNDADEMSNVTHALGMIYDDISDKEREFFFARYGSSEKIKYTIEEHIRHLKRSWVINKKKRAFRNTSILKVSGGYIYIKGAESEANGEFVSLIKKDKKVKVELYSDHIRKIYRHKRRLKTAWENHVVLTYLGSSAVPRPYYMKLPILSSDGYVAMEDMGNKGIEFDRFLDAKYDDMTFAERKMFIDSVALFLRSLFRQRIIHRDMKGCNIFVLNHSHFILLDVEDILFEEIREETLKRMLLQLNTTVPKRISLKHRMRFFLKLTSPLKINRKRLFRDIVEESLGREIVYEGIGGLKIERW